MSETAKAHNLLLKEAIGPLMECCEEPMRKQLDNADYAVWRRNGERVICSSGRPFLVHTRYKIEAFLRPDTDGQEKAGQLKERLKAAGLRGVRELNRSYDLERNRRILNFLATVVEEA